MAGLQNCRKGSKRCRRRAFFLPFLLAGRREVGLAGEHIPSARARLRGARAATQQALSEYKTGVTAQTLRDAAGVRLSAHRSHHAAELCRSAPAVYRSCLTKARMSAASASGSSSAAK